MDESVILQSGSPVDRLMLGPELLKDMELIVKHGQYNFKVAQDGKKSYADLKRTPQEFQVGEHVYVKVKTRKISLRLGKYSKSMKVLWTI